MSVAEFLSAAREVQARRGLSKEVAEDAGGCVCPVGAIKICGGYGALDGGFSSSWGEDADICAAVDMFERANGISHWGIAEWNDEPDRTLEDVLAAFDRAIAAAELAEAP